MSNLATTSPDDLPLLQTERQSHERYTRTASHMAFEIFGIAFAASLVGLLLWRCLQGIHQARVVDSEAAGNALVIILAGAVFAGYLLADFGSGVVHFTFDRFFTTETPLLGKNFVTPFRQHHSDPKDITLHGFTETNGNNCLATCPALIILALAPFDYTVGWQLFVVALVVFGAIGTFATNQFHKWAHSQTPPPAVVWLQEKHLILPRDHHQIHHTHPYDTHYCITTGWLNAILLKVNFWVLLEAIGQRIARMPLYTEETPWERVSGSPAFNEREEMAALNGNAE